MNFVKRFLAKKGTKSIVKVSRKVGALLLPAIDFFTWPVVILSPMETDSTIVKKDSKRDMINLCDT